MVVCGGHEGGIVAGRYCRLAEIRIGTMAGGLISIWRPDRPSSGRSLAEWPSENANRVLLFVASIFCLGCFYTSRDSPPRRRLHPSRRLQYHDFRFQLPTSFAVLCMESLSTKHRLASLLPIDRSLTRIQSLTACTVCLLLVASCRSLRLGSSSHPLLQASIVPSWFPGFCRRTAPLRLHIQPVARVRLQPPAIHRLPGTVGQQRDLASHLLLANRHIEIPHY